MTVDWFLIFIGWLVGIASSLIANWLFQKHLMWKRPKGEYFTTTVSGDEMEFEGRVKMTANTQDIVEEVLGSTLTHSSKHENVDST